MLGHSLCISYFQKSYVRNQHQKTCSHQTKFRFSDYCKQVRPHQTIWDRLAAEGIWFPDHFRYQYDFCVFDFESFLEPCDIVRGNTKFFQKHKCASVAIYTEIENVEPMIYIENKGDTEEMLTSFLDSLEEMSDISFQAKLERYHNQIKSIQAHLDNVKAKIECETRKKKLKKLKRAKNRLVNLKKHFHEFCRELIVCGWNSGFYDLSIIISTLMRILDKRGCLKLKKPGPDEGGEDREVEEEEHDDDLDEYRFAIKKLNKFVAFKTTKLTFRDVMMCLGAGLSLRKFIECFGDGEEFKTFYPYDLMKSIDDLRTPLTDIKYEDFKSSLTGKNVLEEDGPRKRVKKTLTLSSKCGATKT